MIIGTIAPFGMMLLIRFDLSLAATATRDMLPARDVENEVAMMTLMPVHEMNCNLLLIELRDD